MASPSMTVWIDVDDLFHYVKHNSRLSGIQRLTYELYSAIEELAGVADFELGYVRIDDGSDVFIVVDRGEVHNLCHSLTTGTKSPAFVPAARARRQRQTMSLSQGVALARKAALHINHRLPEPARAQFGRYRTLQYEALRSLAQVARSEPVEIATKTISVGRRGQALRELARSGDWFLSLGAPWHRSDYGRIVAKAKAESDLLTGLLVYDLIPLRRPEWCHHTLVATFSYWLDGILPVVDRLFAISKATAADLESLLTEKDCRTPVSTIPIGTGFPASETGVRSLGDEKPISGLPKPRSYVLFVSTIEARKNHLLMFQVWRRLAAMMPPDELPTLVFAGRIGWLVSDLMRQISNTNFCGGKIQIVEDPSDTVLMQLYKGCLFTVMPSFFEGWGLPVTESLALGRPCITSNTTSLPEAGMGLTRMFDPYDLNDATRVVHDTLSDRQALAAWEERVQRDFRPVSWTESAQAILESLGYTGAASSSTGQSPAAVTS